MAEAQKNPMRVVSFDWDYFVEEDPMLDWRHREEGLFYDTIWQIRRLHHNLTKVAPFRGDEMMLAAMAYRLRPKRICVAESHATILQVLKAENIDLVNVDAHHDVFYGRAPCDGVDCGNWGGHLMQQGRIASWTQIYPAWRKKRGFNVDKFPTEFVRDLLCPKVQVAYAEQPMTVGMLSKWRSIDLLFICRSGCWVPPEYDARLEKICSILGVKPLRARSLDAVGVGKEEAHAIARA